MATHPDFATLDRHDVRVAHGCRFTIEDAPTTLAGVRPCLTPGEDFPPVTAVDILVSLSDFTYRVKV